MTKGSLKRMLNPQTVALIGVTEKEDTPGRTLFENLCSWSKDSRKIFMVNPNRKTVLGHECYPEISAVPEHIDLSIIVTPAPTVPEIVEECGKVDTEGIIIISAGFKEIGEEGRILEAQIKTIRDRYGMRIIDQLKSQLMSLVKNRRILDPDSRQLINIKKTPIVDLLRRDTPVREAINLPIQKFVQEIETLRVLFITVENPKIFINEESNLIRIII